MADKEFKKKFPKLAEEMETGVSRTDVEFQVQRPASSRKFAGYDPCVTDFIRRCKNDDQAYEIIEYLENRREVSKEEAEKLCKQIKEEGIRSFGTHKGPGYYDKEG